MNNVQPANLHEETVSSTKIMQMKRQKIIEHWIKGSNQAWEVAQSLFSSKKYPESLFFGHLTIEKSSKLFCSLKMKSLFILLSFTT